jgi:hypothetical protein
MSFWACWRIDKNVLARALILKEFVVVGEDAIISQVNTNLIIVFLGIEM